MRAVKIAGFSYVLYYNIEKVKKQLQIKNLPAIIQIMNDTIYKQIQEQAKASFDELFRKNSALIPTKPELGNILKALESEKKIFQLAGTYYDLDKFPHVEGHVRWNMTGFCWLVTNPESENYSEINEYGLSFNPQENLESIYNKRDAFYNSYVKGKKISLEENGELREFIYVTETLPQSAVKLIATYHYGQSHWVILNSGTGFTFKSEQPAEHGDVAIFEASNLTDVQYLQPLGNMSDYGIESKIIELLGDITRAPVAEFSEISSPKNYRTLDKKFYTIDSLFTKDIDDAIHCEKDDTGFHVWVAIADVSSYVKPHDPQDLHAQQVCTSVYLDHDTVHMLDRQLAETYCSLNPGIAKTSLVCEMHFDIAGVMQSKEFYGAQIMSHSRLTYADVDNVINGVAPQESTWFNRGSLEKWLSLTDNKDISTSLNALYEFSLTQKRDDNRSYWVVEQPEYILGSDGKIDHLEPKEESSASQKMVESAMLAANIAAAQFLYEKYPQFGMFRNQYAPEENSFPKPAFYDLNNEGHWGLKTEFYTHFTSPIRRYCDLLVHRLIKGIVYGEDKTYTNETLGMLAQQINLQQYKSKQFAIKSKNMLLPQYIQKLSATNSLDEKLTIVDFSESGLVCRNKQLVEFFIPSFKLDFIGKDVQKLLPVSSVAGTPAVPLTVEQKKAGIEQLNKGWNVFMKLNNFFWTDERKNAFYQFTRYKPKSLNTPR